MMQASDHTMDAGTNHAIEMQASGGCCALQSLHISATCRECQTHSAFHHNVQAHVAASPSQPACCAFAATTHPQVVTQVGNVTHTNTETAIQPLAGNAFQPVFTSSQVQLLQRSNHDHQRRCLSRNHRGSMSCSWEPHNCCLQTKAEGAATEMLASSEAEATQPFRHCIISAVFVPLARRTHRNTAMHCTALRRSLHCTALSGCFKRFNSPFSIAGRQRTCAQGFDQALPRCI